ncbi:hypothetical protein AVEN_207738-1 [Araneus ventricosus]|uniref:Reverse transcriptase Ty1/copia-type domain-containing protein n=1 Tax=Araneus ventricosus TaxID=182803 RepID=A0A4Y2J8F3_ARAVE|nr:hypothetical protein AVEN_207738-1 [Araneus ventricosus]
MTRARVIQLLDEFFVTNQEMILAVAMLSGLAAAKLQEAGHNVDDLYLGFQMIRYLPQEFQSTVQQIYRWKDGEFTTGKLEAELIFEANRLQFMEQYLEKTDTVFLGSASISRKSSAVPGGADAVPGDVSGNKWYQKEDGKVLVKQNKITQRSVKKIGPCFLCKKYGHLKVNCEDKNTRQKSLNENFNTEFRIKLKFSEAECSLIELNAQSETSCNLSEDISDKGVWAIRSREASEWCDAMDREINVMIERKVWDLGDPPENAKVLGSRWVYTLKHDENNRDVRFKARLVAQGNTQLKGESFDEVFSPVVNFSIVRLFSVSVYVYGNGLMFK